MPVVRVDTYKDLDVWATMPEWSSDPEQELENIYETWEEIGPGWAEEDVDFASEKLRFGYLFESKEEIQDVNDFFDGKLGMLHNFWMPSWRRDIIVNTPILAADASITIDDIKYDEYWLPNRVDGRYLAFLFPDGDYIYRKVISTSGGGTVLNLENAIGKDCPAAELSSLIVSFLYLMRFGIDELEMAYLSDSKATCEITYIAVGLDLTTTTTTTSSSTTTTTGT